jgi:hypothetical protein
MFDGKFQQSLTLGLLGLLLLAESGCAKLDWSRLDPMKAVGLSKSEPEPKVPTRMGEVWSDSVLNQPGLPGVRGFGGRVTFYSDDEKKPVAVDGTLTVYAFDATERDPVHVSPERRFIFPADQMKKHYSPNKLGPSYSIWIPWDEVGGPERQLSLVVRFDDSTGATITSTPSRQTLPGLPGVPLVATPTATQSVRQASYDAARTPAAPVAITSFTMDVPPSFGQKLAAGAPATSQADIPSRYQAAVSAGTQPAPTGAVASQAQASQAQSAAAASPSVSYGPRRFPARRAPFAEPNRDPLRRQPRPAASLSALPPTPRVDLQSATQEPLSTGEQAKN